MIEQMIEQNESGQRTGLEIAVIGMAGRFPGARNINEFWDNLIHNVEAITFFSDPELEAEGISRELLDNPNYVKARGILEGIERFDCSFFNYTPREAETMDPQLRLFHECAWETLENAGYCPGTFNGPVGVYVGAAQNFRWLARTMLNAMLNAMSNGLDLSAAGFSDATLNDKDYLGLRISYKLDLKGPSITFNTTCSTSLVAVHLGFQGLLSGECDMALAGGVRIVLPPKAGYLYQDHMVMSADGHCRAFDAGANGTVGGSGVGAVLLKRLEEAVADGDHIYAIVRGSGVNNDGAGKVGFTAPSVGGQTEVIRAALQMADVEPESIGYVETHGTATTIGDPIEMEALKQAFDTPKKGFCALGSVKTNVGHLDAAAGITGFIKTVLALNHRILPASLNFHSPNPRIDFINSPFYINTTPTQWKSQSYPLRAGVSSFGIGGTNVHVILEEAPARMCAQIKPTESQLLVLSAKSQPALERMTENVRNYFITNADKGNADKGNADKGNADKDITLADVAYTLQVGRKAFNYRRWWLVTGWNEAIDALHSQEPGETGSYGENKITTGTPVVWVFKPNHGNNSYLMKAMELYRGESLFRDALDTALSYLSIAESENIKMMIKSVMTEPGNRPVTGMNKRTENLLQILFQYALATCFMELGITPDVILGDSSCEYMAAHFSGVFSLECALTLVEYREKLLENNPGNLNETYLNERIEEKIGSFLFSPPQIPYVSHRTGNWITVEEAVDRDYWTDHAQNNTPWVPVSETVSRFLEEQNAMFVDLDSALNDFFAHIGRLWAHGMDVRWPVLSGEKKRRRTPLPAYSFDHQVFSVDTSMVDVLLKNGSTAMAPPSVQAVKKIEKSHMEPQALYQRPSSLKSEYAPPGSESEKKLVKLWQELFGIEHIGAHDHFFELGGDSLKATIVLSRISEEFNVNVPLKEFFGRLTIECLAEYIETLETKSHMAVTPVEKKEYYLLSPVQKRLYVLQYLDPGGTAYNLPQTVPLDDHVDLEKLERVFLQLIKRHESLRTSYFQVNEQAVQKIHENSDPGFSIQYDVKAADFVKPFDLSTAPLFRVGISGVGTTSPLLLIDMHHIITDGTSQEILKQEFTALYAGEVLRPLRLQYKDFSEWLNRGEQRKRVKQQESYWLRRFSGDVPVLNLPVDYPRPPVQSFAGAMIHFALDAPMTGALRDMAAKTNTTFYMVILSIFTLLLSKLSGQEDIIVGTPIAARRHAHLQSIIGMFVNTLAMRNEPVGEKTFGEFLDEIRHHTLHAFENQEYPFEELVEHVGVQRDTGRNPVFDTMFALQNMADRKNLVVPRNPEQQSQIEHRVAKFDLTLNSYEAGDQLACQFEYCTALFTRPTVESFVDYFKHIAASVITDRHQLLSQIDMMTPGAKQRVLHEFNDTAASYPDHKTDHKTVHQLFGEQVERTPDRVALVGSEDHRPQLTYAMLNHKADQLADRLTAMGVGVGTGTIVGMMVGRSVGMIVNILGILKAGGAPLPIDPDYPTGRILYMLKDAGVSLLLSDGPSIKGFPVTALKTMGRSEENLNAHIVLTPRRNQITDLDRLPLPDRALIDYGKYQCFIGLAPVKHSVTLQATRGCPYHCLFCHKIWPKNHVARSADHIYEEISRLYDAGIRRFVFIDDIFNLERKNSARLLQMIIKNRLDIQLFFPNGFRGDILDREFIDLMVGAGTVNIDVALESASPRIQKLIRKNLNLDKFRDNIRYLTEKYPHVIVEMEMMFGFPTETEDEALMTLEFLKGFRWIHFPNLHMLKIYPNTDMYRLALESGISPEAIERSTHLAYHQAPETLPFSASFARQFQAKLMGEYFLRSDRLIEVLGQQAKSLTEDDLVQKYGGYLRTNIEHFDDLLDKVGISREQWGDVKLIPDSRFRVPDVDRRIRRHFPLKEAGEDAFRVLLLDFSLLFGDREDHTFRQMVEEPLGLMYLMTSLNERFGERICGKVFKSGIDLGSFDELTSMVRDFKPHLIGIRSLTYFKEFFHEAVLMIRHRDREVVIVAGGPYATSDYPLVLQDGGVDLVVLGEGEETLGELVGAMMATGNRLPPAEELAKIPGLAFREKRPEKRSGESRNAGMPEILLPDQWVQWDGGGMSNRLPRNPGGADDLFYVLYTSGSTGQPKGVTLEHRNLVNLVYWGYANTNLDFSVVLQFATICFDVSFQEIFSTLLWGGRLCLISGETRADIPGLFEVIEKNGIKTLFLPSAFLTFLFNHEDYIRDFPRCVDHIQAAGEQLQVGRALARFLATNGIHLHNHYGPSETHVVTALTLSPTEDIPALPSIGKPISNTVIYILGQYRTVQPVGVVGELCVSGSALGRGYLNRPELTAEKFPSLRSNPNGGPGRASPWPPEARRPSRTGFIERLYQTGDLARWLRDGNIEFLGRMDFQVKIRGFRIETGEIEQRLLSCEDIKDAVVLCREADRGDKYLCGYVVPVPGGQVSPGELKEYVSQSLPDYMVPAHLVIVDRLPLTINGKVDRKALPAPEVAVGQDYIAPRTGIEKQLVDTWSDVLGIDTDTIGIDSNFFELGGHSLKATILVARIHKEFRVKFPLAEVFKNPHIRGMAEYINKLEKDEKYASIEPVEKKEYYPLSPAQKRLYVLQQLDLKGTAYNMPAAIPLSGGTDMKKLEDVFRQLIDRHESLRTSYFMVGNQPVQKIHKTGDYNFKIAPPSIPLAMAASDFIRPFDLGKAPLLRVGVIGVGTTSPMLLIDMHHISTDGISMEILKKEFVALYAGEALTPLRLQYKDFSEWQNSVDQRKLLKQQEKFWLDCFSDECPVLNLPLDYPRPRVRSFGGAIVNFQLDEMENRALNAIAAEAGVTLYMIILSVFTILLSKLSGQEDIAVGTPIAARGHSDLEHIIGMFVNTLVMRHFPMGEKSVGEFLSEMKARTLKAFENQEYPLEELVEQAWVKRDPGRNPLFDVMFALQNMADRTAGLEIDVESGLEHRVAKFDLTLTCFEAGDQLLCCFEYCTALFTVKTVERFVIYFKQIAAAVIGDRKQKISGIEIITAEEKQRILHDFNDTKADYLKDKTPHQLFGEQVELGSDRIALVGISEGQPQLTYDMLNRGTNQLAVELMKRGVKTDTIVGIMTERSVEMVVGMLGILKAGGAYMPVDPDYPDERKQYMLGDSGTGICLTGKDIAAFSLALDASGPMFLSPSNPSNLAYVIYTSGSTGRPKGVLIRHRGVVNLVHAHRGVFGENPSSRISQVSGPAFDAMAFEVWPCLAAGACLCIVDNETRANAPQIKEWLIRHQITISFQSTLMAQALLDEPWPVENERSVSLKVLRTAGDRLTRYPARQYPFRLYNLYGPTEDTVWTTWSQVALIGASKEPVTPPTIGKPVANHRVYILGSGLAIQPMGIVGELCIAGIGLARGYLNNPGLSAERFIKLPLHKSYRTYKTGDLARWLLDGNLEFLGRLDHQVKIRGYRIETGEIEQRLLSVEDIKEAVVLCREAEKGNKDNKYLCAYIVPVADKPIPSDELRGFLLKSLPDYMVPVHFTTLDRLPLTPNGKIDRRALPAPEISAAGYVSPRNGLERGLVDLWAGVLGVELDLIGIDSNFFDLGGHSLTATVLSSRIHAELGCRVPVVEIFRTPTVRGLAEYISKHRQQDQETVGTELVLLKGVGGRDRNLFFMHDGTGTTDGYIELCRGPEIGLNCWGIPADPGTLNATGSARLPGVVGGYIERMRGVQPDGPYVLCGWSLGGTLAFEAARQLEGMGEAVSLLVLIDCQAPGEDAVLSYVPVGRVVAPVHYVKAAETPGHVKEGWDDWCVNPITYHEVPGDHYSMLKAPLVGALAELVGGVV